MSASVRCWTCALGSVAGRVTNWLGIKENQKMAGRVASSKATKFYTYSRTARSNTEYATKMKRLSNQIFGEVGWVEKFLALKKIFR